MNTSPESNESELPAAVLEVIHEWLIDIDGRARASKRLLGISEVDWLTARRDAEASHADLDRLSRLIGLWRETAADLADSRRALALNAECWEAWSAELQADLAAERARSWSGRGC